jgi:hypothetical protein
MDVGLNNRNTLGDIAPEFEDVVFLIEATSTEQLNLWSELCKQSMTNIESIPDGIMDQIQDRLGPGILFDKISELNQKTRKNNISRVDWEQIPSGFGITIGHVGKSPIHVCFSFAIINGKKICFYEATSQVINHKMIEDWLISRFQLTNDNYSRWNHTNAMNFHNCIQAFDRLDELPRDTVYEIEK